ncbi:hypothetical protein F6X53_16670 [Methylobacterium soli]|uniref:Uncharacterized protein n=2 Tax=Methylobacterium soli TaxID=553447 RepID=A0A6L3T023_9HYPH|nr:hypothetical protein [Methylobacterium soli]KAB1077849.1 hypothetical protein F6X53_16670 [Methylobacterium soli]
MTGWSLVYIDKYVPRTKVGGKVLILVDALENFLPGGNPLFRGEGSPFALGLLFQWNEGSPYDLGSDDWKRFGSELVDAFRGHLKATGAYDTVTTLEDALAWSKTVEGQAFFDQHIPSPGRQRRFAVYAK